MIPIVAVAMPDVFAVVFDSILTKLTMALGQSQNLKVIEAVQSVLQTVVTPRPVVPGAKAPVKRMQLTYLAEIGFSGIPDCGSFTLISKTRKKQAATYASQLLQVVLK